MNCLACGRELPEAADLLKNGNDCEVNLIFCACQAIMAFDQGTLRPPRVNEVHLFVQEIWPTIMNKPEIAEAIHRSAMDPTGKLHYACFTNKDQPYPKIKNFETKDSCPECQTAFSRMRGRCTPRPGGLTLCSHCSAVSVIGDDMKSRPPTKEEAEGEFYKRAMDTAAAVAIKKAERQAAEN